MDGTFASDAVDFSSIPDSYQTAKPISPKVLFMSLVEIQYFEITKLHEMTNKLKWLCIAQNMIGE